MRLDSLLVSIVLLMVAMIAGDSFVAASSHAIPSPLIMWSTETILREKILQENLYTRSLVDAIKELSEINPVVSGNELLRKHGWNAPDVVVVYLVSELSTAAFRSQDNANIKRAVKSAHDSQTASYFYQDASDSLDAALGLATQVSAPLEADTLNQFISAAAASGRTKVLVVRAASLADADTAVAMVEEALHGTKRRAVSILTAASAVFSDAYMEQEPAAPLLTEAFSSRRVLRDSNDTTTPAPTTVVPNDCNSTTCYDTYWPADISSGLIVGGLLVVILAIALSSMTSLQSPERFEGSQKRMFISRVQPR